MKSVTKTRLFTARLVFGPGNSLINGGAVLVRGGGIAAMGPRGDFPTRPDYPETDLGAAVLAPGLVNAHCHLEYACCEGRLESGSFLKWLPNMIALKRSLGEEEIGAGAGGCLERMIRSGATAVGDITTYGISPALLKESGVRYSVFREVISMARPPYKETIDSIARDLAGFSPGPRGTQGLAPHTPFTVARPLMVALRRKFHRGGGGAGAAEGLPFSIHVAESRSEITCLRHRRGVLARALTRSEFYPARASDIPLAASVLDFVEAGKGARKASGAKKAAGGARDLLVHGNFLSVAEMRTLAESDRYTLAVCPGTRLFHGVSTPVLDRALRAGLPLALGTDSLASNDSASLWTEMRRSLRMGRRWKPMDAWRAATEGGARALGLEDKAGRLRPGWRADFLAVSLEGGALAEAAAKKPGANVTAEALVSEWLTGESPPRVIGTWVDGKALFQEGEE